MTVNKIQKYAESKKISVPSLAKILGRDKQVLYQFFERNDCRVSDLEKMSKALGVSPAFWWKEENENVVKEPIEHYGKMEIELLRSQLKDKDKLIARLEKELERYESKKTGSDDLIMATHNGDFKTPRMQH